MKSWIYFLLIFTALLNVKLVFAAPDIPVVQHSSETGTYRMIIPSSQAKAETVSIVHKKIAEKHGKKGLNAMQFPPDYRFKPAMPPYTLGETFSISTPVRFVSF